MNYDRPGNVRQLQNVIQHAIALGSTEIVLPEDLPDLEKSALKGFEAKAHTYHKVMYETKRHLLENAFAGADGDYRQAALLLGLKSERHPPVSEESQPEPPAEVICCVYEGVNKSLSLWDRAARQPAGQAALSPVSELHHGLPTDCLFLYFGRLRPNHIKVDKHRRFATSYKRFP